MDKCRWVSVRGGCMNVGMQVGEEEGKLAGRR